MWNWDTFIQPEEGLVGAFSMIVKTDGLFAALPCTTAGLLAHSVYLYFVYFRYNQSRGQCLGVEINFVAFMKVNDISI